MPEILLYHDRAQLGSEERLRLLARPAAAGYRLHGDAATTDGLQSGTVQIRATGSVEAVPDVAVLDMSVEITETSDGAARDRAAGLTQAVIDELERHRVEERDSQTNRFSIHTDY